MMAVLSLPPRPQVVIDCDSDANSEEENVHFRQEPYHFTIRALLDYYEAEETIHHVKCRVCDVVNAHSRAKPRFEFTSDIIIFRIINSKSSMAKTTRVMMPLSRKCILFWETLIVI